IVMEGFLRLEIGNWLRGLIRGWVGVIGVMVWLMIFKGNGGKIEEVVVLCEVFLSIGVPLCLIPLELGSSNKELMGGLYNKR
ncbi:divalent metal cation transporter, partial [Staphylococcus aureus]|uniref:divalent metal cation transporter n=1 Tax=Staphylococcus aureus TaxID=1280 RepID=UPI001642D809